MKRIISMVTVALVMALMLALAGPALATIHPIVESVDCANPIRTRTIRSVTWPKCPGRPPTMVATLIRARCARSVSRTRRRGSGKS